MTSLGRHLRSGASRHIASIVILALAVIAASCGEAERPTLVGPEVAPADQLRRDNGGVEQATGTTGVLDPATETSTFADSGSSFAATGSDTDDPTSAAAGIEGAVRPADGGVSAVFTPTGVLAAVLGQTDDAYLIQTPCGFEAAVPLGQTLTSVDVMLDPGHGGDEEGAVAESGLTEASINLRVSQRTAELLSQRGVSVALTRTGDYRVPITQRAALSDALGAKALVSIHHNTPRAAESTIPGTEVYVQSTSPDSQRLGGLMYERVVADLAQFDVPWVARTDAGVLTVLNDEGVDAYGINRRPATPSALIEVGYLANPAEAALFATDEYVEVVSVALMTGIERYLRTQDPGSGYVSTPRSFNPSGATGGQSDCVDPALN